MKILIAYTDSAFWVSYYNVNYYLAKANPTPNLRNAICDLSLASLIKVQEGYVGAVKSVLSDFVPKFLSNIESLV